MSKCTKCGFQIKENHSFCENCGSKVKTPVQSTPRTAVASVKPKPNRNVTVKEEKTPKRLKSDSRELPKWYYPFSILIPIICFILEVLFLNQQGSGPYFLFSLFWWILQIWALTNLLIFVYIKAKKMPMDLTWNPIVAIMIWLYLAFDPQLWFVNILNVLFLMTILVSAFQIWRNETS